MSWMTRKVRFSGEPWSPVWLISYECVKIVAVIVRGKGGRIGRVSGFLWDSSSMRGKGRRSKGRIIRRLANAVMKRINSEFELV